MGLSLQLSTRGRDELSFPASQSDGFRWQTIPRIAQFSLDAICPIIDECDRVPVQLEIDEAFSWHGNREAHNFRFAGHLGTIRTNFK